MRRCEYVLLGVTLYAIFSQVFAYCQDSSTSQFSAETPTTSCAAPTYNCARSDLITTNNLNPPPNMGHGKNTLVTPSDFELPIVRVTDGTLFLKRTFAETPSGSAGDNIFSVNDTYLLVADDYGWRYPVSFNPSTMQIANSNTWSIGKNQTRWGGSSSFSRVNGSEVFTVMSDGDISGVTPNGTTLMRITLSGTSAITAKGGKVFDFARCPGMRNPYKIGYPIWRSTLTVSAGDRRFSSAFSDLGGQGTGGDVVVYDAPSGQCYRYDTLHARLCTANGCAPMSVSDEFTVHSVTMSLNGDYLRVDYAKCLKGGCLNDKGAHPYYWAIGTPNVVHCYTSSGTANCTGHQIEGYSHIYNSTNWPATAKRSFTDPLSYTLLNPSPTLEPATDNHYSNNAANPYDTNPVWVTNVQNVRTTFGGKGCQKTGDVYLGCTFPGPLYGEVFGIKQNGGYIRAAHTYNSGSSPYFDCAQTIGAVSQSGRFFAWSSDWLNTLGTDDMGRHRCDVFIVNLAAARGATN